MHVSVFICVHVCALCACVCVHVYVGHIPTTGIIINHSPPCFWSHSFSLNLELFNLAMLSSQHTFSAPPLELKMCATVSGFMNGVCLNSGPQPCIADTSVIEMYSHSEVIVILPTL